MGLIIRATPAWLELVELQWIIELLLEKYFFEDSLILVSEMPKIEYFLSCM